MSKSPGMEGKGISRRKFILRSTFGAGVILGAGYFAMPLLRRAIAAKVDQLPPLYLGNTKDPLIWFDIRNDNLVYLHCPKVEMGQGVFTGLAQIAADELGAHIDQMRVIHARSDSGNLDRFATGGSFSTAGLWQPLRELAATMREMLKNEAARLLAVAPGVLVVSDGKISGEGQSLTFGEVVKEVREWTIPKQAPLRDSAGYKYIGRPVPRLDQGEKVRGASVYGMDVSLPGMVYGTVLMAPKIGARLVEISTTEAVLMPGVIKVIKEHDFIGVVAETQRQAEMAKRTIQATWENDTDWQLEKILQMVRDGKGKKHVIQKHGNPMRFLNNGGNMITAEFTSPIGAHAQIEPNVAVADVRNGRAEVHISTQVIKNTRDEVASRLGFRKQDVNIVPMHLGGGFGRRLHTPHAMQAAVMSRAVGRPVRYFIDREDEFQHDAFRPPTHHMLKATLADGRIEAIEHMVSGGDVMYGSAVIPDFLEHAVGADLGNWRGGMIQYESIPNYRVVSRRVKLPFKTSWWRGLGLLANTFAIESFMDELAFRAGKDPVGFRLDHIPDNHRGFRLKEVIRAAAGKAGYRNDVHKGRAMGFAVSRDYNTPVAQVAEVSVEGYEIIVHKVTCAIDVGKAINPDQIRAQCEGAIVMGMSAAMFEKMEIIDGRFRPTIYGPYKMAMMKHTPKEIDVVVLQNDDVPGGVGEPPIGPIGAAIANAVFRLTGKRLREMPFSLEA